MFAMLIALSPHAAAAGGTVQLTCATLEETLQNPDGCSLQNSSRKFRLAGSGERLYGNGIDGDIREPFPLFVAQDDADTLVLVDYDPVKESLTLSNQRFTVADAATAIAALDDLQQDGQLDLVIADEAAGSAGELTVYYDAAKATSGKPDIVETGVASFDLYEGKSGLVLDGFDAQDKWVVTLSW